MFKYKKYILLTMLCATMQNMCMAVPLNHNDQENNGPLNRSPRLNNGQLPQVALNEIGNFVLQFNPLPALQPEDHIDRNIRDLNEPDKPKKDIYAGLDPESHIKMMFAKISFSLTNLQGLREKKEEFLKDLKIYLESNFMKKNRSSIMINGQRVLKRQNFIDRILKCMKIVLNYGNDVQFEQSLYTLSSIIKADGNSPDIHAETMVVSDYIKELKSQALQAEKKAETLKLGLCNLPEDDIPILGKYL